MTTAKIHSFESLGTVDGPGIRFVIFFQGCHLKCKYCHNRDLWDCSIGKEYTMKELCMEVIKHKDFFDHGGGITVTGGEPLLQAEFLAEFFETCQALKIHTALDTAGSVPLTKNVRNVLQHTNLVLLDIKHIDDEKGKELTGSSNKNTLAFAQYLNDKKIPMWIRYVVVPGYTDSPEDVKKLADFLAPMTNIEKIEVLPYHEMGKHKWELMGDKYQLENVKAPTKDSIENIKKILERK
jgi:pyruvate formate lyase activating enzyme